MIGAIMNLVMVVVMMMLGFAFGLFFRHSATAVALVRGFASTRMRVSAAFPAWLRLAIGSESGERACSQAAVVRHTAEARVAFAEARVSLMAEGDIRDPRSERRQVRAIGADLHEKVFAEVHSLVAAAPEVHDGVAAGQRGRRGDGGRLGAGLRHARAPRRRRAMRLHHHWRGAAAEARRHLMSRRRPPTATLPLRSLSRSRDATFASVIVSL